MLRRCIIAFLVGMSIPLLDRVVYDIRVEIMLNDETHTTRPPRMLADYLF